MVAEPSWDFISLPSRKQMICICRHAIYRLFHPSLFHNICRAGAGAAVGLCGRARGEAHRASLLSQSDWRDDSDKEEKQPCHSVFSSDTQNILYRPIIVLSAICSLSPPHVHITWRTKYCQCVVIRCPLCFYQSDRPHVF